MIFCWVTGNYLKLCTGYVFKNGAAVGWRETRAVVLEKLCPAGKWICSKRTA